MHVERAGKRGPRLLLIHGSLAAGWRTWEAQRPLADDHRLVVVHRPGYPPNPPRGAVSFEHQAHEIAELVKPGTHLVGHSYGGVLALVTAGLVGDQVASVTVIEPPAFGLARGRPEVEAFVARMRDVLHDPSRPVRDLLEGFIAGSGSSMSVPDTISPELEASVHATVMETPPWEAEIHFDALRTAGFPLLVFSGAHSGPFDIVCDILVGRLGAEREVIGGKGHSVQRTGAPFNERLAEFVARTESRR